MSSAQPYSSPSRSGLPEGHPWSAMPRREMAWRTAVISALVSMFGVLLLTAAGLLNPTAPPLVGGWTSVLIGLGLPVLYGLLALLLARWLRRFGLLVQGLIFGVIATAVVFAALGAWAAIDSALHPCEPGTGCWGSGFFFVVTLLFYFLPVLLLSVLGYAVTIAVSGRPGAQRGFWIAFWIVLAVFALVVAVQAIVG